MVATDAAGEGINLQQAHLLVNYDLPWNPNRIEQRFGRVHRIGQTEVCHMWNLVAAETREGEVYLRLLDKLDEQRAALGGQVFDVLGEALPGRNLRDLLLEAVRYGDRPEVRARLDEVIDARVGDGLAELVRAHALASDVMSIAVQSVRLRMEEAAARRLQPHHVSAFFLAALEHVGGRAVPREAERFEVTHVPAAVRTLDRQRGGGRAPLLADTSGSASTRTRCTCPADRWPSWSRIDATGRPTVVSRHVGFVALSEGGETIDAGPAPYLDLRPATDDELAALRDRLREPWLHADVEQRAVGAAVRGPVPRHLGDVRERTTERVARSGPPCTIGSAARSATWTGGPRSCGTWRLSANSRG